MKAIAPMVNRPASTADPRTRMPTFGCQVTVQSQAEKDYLKQMRKENRKASKRQNKGDENGNDRETEYLMKQIR